MKTLDPGELAHVSGGVGVRIPPRVLNVVQQAALGFFSGAGITYVLSGAPPATENSPKQ